MPVDLGAQAPDFELRDQHNQPVRLADYRGKRHVTVVFYLMAFSRICDRELGGLRDDLAAFDNDDAALLAVSCDAPATHRRQAEQDGYRFPLLSDFWPHGEVARTYGVFDEGIGLALRGTFIVDRDGKVVYTDRNPVPQARDQQAWKSALKEIGAL